MLFWHLMGDLTKWWRDGEFAHWADKHPSGLLKWVAFHADSRLSTFHTVDSPGVSDDDRKKISSQVRATALTASTVAPYAHARPTRCSPLLART